MRPNNQGNQVRVSVPEALRQNPLTLRKHTASGVERSEGKMLEPWKDCFKYAPERSAGPKSGVVVLKKDGKETLENSSRSREHMHIPGTIR